MSDTPSASPSRTRRAARGPVVAGAVLLALLAALVAGLQLTYRPLPPPDQRYVLSAYTGQRSRLARAKPYARKSW